MAHRRDLILQFLRGPLSTRPPSLTLGSEILLGHSPSGPGISLSEYRGLEADHAVMTMGPRGTVTIHAIDPAEVRVAPQRDVLWRELPPLDQPRTLSEGDVIHLGVPHKGVSFIFMGTRPGRSTADPVDPATQRSRAFPWLPTLLLFLIALAVVLHVLTRP